MLRTPLCKNMSHKMSSSSRLQWSLGCNTGHCCWKHLCLVACLLLNDLLVVEQSETSHCCQNFHAFLMELNELTPVMSLTGTRTSKICPKWPCVFRWRTWSSHQALVTCLACCLRCLDFTGQALVHLSRVVTLLTVGSADMQASRTQTSPNPVWQLQSFVLYILVSRSPDIAWGAGAHVHL